MTPLERNTEAVLLAACLSGAIPCDRQCGRLATVEATDAGWYPPMCDECGAEVSRTWAKDAVWTDIRQAKRVRRLEALLRGE